MSTVSRRRGKGYRHTTRKELNQDVIITIAWVLPNEKTNLSLFPEVIFVDCVTDANSDKRPLLTLAGEDSKGKMYTILKFILSLDI